VCWGLRLHQLGKLGLQLSHPRLQSFDLRFQLIDAGPQCRDLILEFGDARLSDSGLIEGRVPLRLGLGRACALLGELELDLGRPSLGSSTCEVVLSGLRFCFCRAGFCRCNASLSRQMLGVGGW
jgi:hypothetical protein